MKQGVSILLILIMGLQVFYPLAMYSYYYANKNYFATVLCENKAKPQLKCNGKCFLKKQIKKAEKEDSKEKTMQKGAEVVFYIPSSIFKPEHFSYTVPKDYPPFKLNNYLFLFDRSCFRPPGV